MSNYRNRLNRAKFAFNPRANRTTAKSNNPRRSTPLCTPLADRTLANATYRTFHCVQYSRGICETRFPRLKLSRENIFTPLSLHSVIVRAISKPYARSTAYYKTLCARVCVRRGAKVYVIELLKAGIGELDSALNPYTYVSHART